MPFVLKLNACGEKEWCNVFFGSTNIGQAAWDIKETANGDIVALINWFGSNPEETLHLFKMNAAGDMIWQQAFASHYNHPQSVENIGSSLLITSENKYLITGTGYWQHPWNPQGGYWIRGFFVMVDSDGNEEWVLPFGLNDTITSHASYSIELSNNCFLAIADIRSSPLPGSMLIFFDTTGTVTNQVSIPIASIGPGIADGDSRRINLVDSVYVIGGFYGPDYLSTKVTDFLLDTNLMAGINILGHRQHPKTLTSIKTNITHDQKILGITSYRDIPPHTDLYAYKLNLNLEFDSAYTGSYTYDSLCIPGPPQSGIVYLDNCDIILGTEIPTAAEYRARIHTIPITIYPNPAKDKVTFALENTQHHRNIELRCFNLLGMQQYQTKILRGQQQSTANVSNWPPGMYIAVVYSDGKPVGRGKFVVMK